MWCLTKWSNSLMLDGIKLWMLHREESSFPSLPAQEPKLLWVQVGKNILNRVYVYCHHFTPVEPLQNCRHQADGNNEEYMSFSQGNRKQDKAAVLKICCERRHGSAGKIVSILSKEFSKVLNVVRFFCFRMHGLHISLKSCFCILCTALYLQI